MSKYFVNRELKISSSIIILFMFFSVLMNIIIVKAYNDDMKKDYINTVGAISARIIDSKPYLENEIMPLVTKDISKEDEAKGESFLSKYGVSSDLENSIFPYLNNSLSEEYALAIIMFLILTVSIFSLNMFQHVYFYNRIRNLTEVAKKVIDGDFTINITENKEGDFSRLANIFNMMKDVIRKNIKELNEEKDFLIDIFSDISHQLKTPLAAMVIYNDILLEKELTKEKRDVILINNQNQLNKMRWLIQSILKLARLDAKAIVFDKKVFCINETVRNSMDALEVNLNEKKVIINLNETEDIYFEHDTVWLEEAFVNILKNCFEHSSEFGHIWVKLYQNPIYIRVEIEDDGEGIDENDLPNIFKRFYKGKTSKNSDSVGIGLALSKSIVEAHNGYIDVKSEIKKGTKFIITFLKY